MDKNKIRFPFECQRCGHKPHPQEVLEHKGDCTKCRDLIWVFTIDAAECIMQLLAELAKYKPEETK